MDRPPLLAGPPHLDADPAGPVKYPITRLLGRETPDVARTWQTGPVLNQGRLGACMAFSWVGAYMAQPGGPSDTTLKTATAYALNYHQALLTSGGPELALARGMIGSYWWVDSVDNLRDAVITTGPVAIGLPWFDTMFTPSRGGRLTVKRRPRDPGWHSLLITGYHPAAKLGPYTGPAFRLRNSWGRWGLNGDCWITRADMTLLYLEHPDPTRFACVPVGRTAVPVADLLRTYSAPQA